MAQLQENTDGIVAALYVSTRSDGNRSPLSREELRLLMEQEFADAMENPQDPKTVKKVLCFLDDDSNGKVDFSELLSLVFRMAKACYKPRPLQQRQAPGEGQEPAVQEKAGGEQPRAAGRVSRSQQVPKQGVNNQVQDTETQDPDTRETQEGDTQEKDQDNRETQEGDTQEKDQDNRETQEGDTQEEDQDNRETQEGDTQEEDQDNRETQEGDTQEKDQDNRQTQKGDTQEKDQDNRQTQEGDTQEKDQDNRQTQEGETPEQDQDSHQDDRTEAPEGDPKRGEILDTETSEQDRNTRKADETETPKQDPKTHQAQENEAPGQGSNHPQSPEMESAEQDLNCPSETRGRDPNNKAQVCEAPQQDPDHSETQRLLPPQRGASPRRDPKPQGTSRDLPESKVLEQEHSGAEDPSRPAQQQEDAHGQRKPPLEQQLLQSLYEWPPQQ